MNCRTSLRLAIPWLVLLTALTGCGSRGEPAHVILISMDTTRADRLGCYGCETASTPTLDRFSQTATLFENAHTASPITLPSHTTMMTGRTPIGHAVRYNGWRREDTSLPTLAELLGAAGYTTAAFVSAAVLRHNHYVARGFQTYDDDFPVERADAETAQRAIEFLERKPAGPLFLWVHFFNPHDPYDPPEPFASDTRGSAYDAEVSSMDHAIGRLLDALERTGHAERAHIIMVADHGEGLGDRGGYMDHGLVLYEEATRVPLIWHTPGQKKGRRDGSLTGCVDLLPTVLDLLGLEEARETEGVSLKAQLRGKNPQDRAGLYIETIATHIFFKWSPLYAWRTAGEKYVASSVPELYDLDDDPRELKNLAVQRRASVEQLHTDLTAYMETWTAAGTKTSGPLDERERAMLESLGYIQTGGGDHGAADPHGIPALDDLNGLASPRDHIAVERNFTDAFYARRAKAWERVIENYEAVLKKLPNSPAVPLGMAEALLAVYRPAEALAWLERHLEFRPADAAVLQRMLGDASMGAGRYADAARAYDRVPASEADIDFLMARIRLAVLLGDEAGAHTKLQALQEAFPRHPKIRAWDAAIDALAQWGTERPAGAARDLSRQIRAMVELGLIAEAREMMSAGGAVLADTVQARLQGDIAFGGGEWCEAQAAYARALARGARFPEHSRLDVARRRCRRETQSAERRPIDRERASPTLDTH